MHASIFEAAARLTCSICEGKQICSCGDVLHPSIICGEHNVMVGYFVQKSNILVVNDGAGEGGKTEGIPVDDGAGEGGKTEGIPVDDGTGEGGKTEGIPVDDGTGEYMGIRLDGLGEELPPLNEQTPSRLIQRLTARVLKIKVGINKNNDTNKRNFALLGASFFFQNWY